MNLDLIDRDGKKVNTVDVNDSIFNHSYNEALIHQILVSYQSNARGGNRAQKDRSMVKCSTKKPSCIIANTIKGKGISFMENKIEWHYQAPSQKQFKIAIKELSK